MNFYKRYPGDYARDTGHLSLLEHGAYTLLLDRYYSTGAIPSQRNEVYTLCRASKKSERAAVDKVLSQFFPDNKNPRADEEIAKWNAKATQNREVGKLGGRPKKNPDGLDTVTQTVTEMVSRKNPPRSQIPEEESKSGCAASPIDPRRQIFELGKSILGANSGGLISKAIKQTDEATVGAVLGEMALKPKADPRAYFAAATQPKQSAVVV